MVLPKSDRNLEHPAALFPVRAGLSLKSEILVGESLVEATLGTTLIELSRAKALVHHHKNREGQLQPDPWVLEDVLIADPKKMEQMLG